MKKSIINWSEVSRLLAGDRGAIRSNYGFKKYAEAVKELREFSERWIKKYINK